MIAKSFVEAMSRVIGVIGLSVLAGIRPGAAADLATPVKFNIPAQELPAALLKYSEQSGVQITSRSEVTEGKTSTGVVGAFSASEALDRLLGGTGLVFRYIDENTITIVPRADASTQATPADEKRSTVAVDEVVVTGTQIRGVQPSAPVVIITQEQMRLSGHANLGEVVRAMPQNFSGGQNPGIGLGATGNNANYTGSSSLNLRGLGADATLTLLNGTRMPYDGLIQATDVSVIPVAAIDRMEILLDGASAIYGSDAVGGVANIVLKKDYEGAEVSARYGVATDGGFHQQQYNAIAGTTWSSGGFLLTGDLSKNTPVYARQRDFLGAFPNQGVTIFPDYEQQSVLFSGHQLFGDGVELSFDAFYTDRDTHDISETAALLDSERDSIIWGVAPAVRFGLPGDWSARVHGTFGKNENTNKLRAFALGSGVELIVISPITQYLNTAETIGVGADGPLFSLPGGDARVSVGAGYRSAEFEQIAVLAGTRVVSGASHSHHAFGEINLPVVSQVTINGALRYESYGSFGDVTTPKLGAIWKPLESVSFKASWGKSFKAPTLTQQFESGALYRYPSFFFPGLPPNTDVMYAGGGRRTLDPERAEIMTAGFVLTPAALPGFRFEVSAFDIDYTDRVVMPLTNITQAALPQFADFVHINPSVAEQNAAFATAGLPVGTFTSDATGTPYNPANVGAIIHNMYANATADSAKGVDVGARYALDVPVGRLAFTMNASWIDAERQLTRQAQAFDASGSIFFPAKFKGQLGTQWSRNGFTLTGNINHIGGVTNTNLASLPKGASLTTIDLIADYRPETGPLRGFGINLATLNLFNQAPPSLQASQVFFPPYDSTNYSALGRTVGATVTKRF